MKAANEPGQAMQRVKVAFTGLSIVLVLIAVASLLMSTVGHNRTAVAGASASATTGRVAGNSADPSEPLAELGVTPSTQSNGAIAAASAP